MRAAFVGFFSRFFWGVVSNDDAGVSTGAAMAIAVVICWLANMKPAATMNSAEVLLLAGGLMAIPKAKEIFTRKKGDSCAPPQS